MAGPLSRGMALDRDSHRPSELTSWAGGVASAALADMTDEKGLQSASGEVLLNLYRQECRNLGFEIDQNQLVVIKKLEDLRDGLLRRGPSNGALERLFPWIGTRPAERGIYLWGNVGRGKTWLMDLFFRSLPFQDKSRTHFYRFMQTLHNDLLTLRGRREPLEAVAVKLAQSNRLICFDELFVSDIGDAMLLGPLFDRLFSHGVTLVITSNAPPDDLYKDGLQRARFLPAIAQIKSHMDVIKLDHPHDYRLRHLVSQTAWFSTDDPETEVRLHSLFRRLSAGGDAESNALRINQHDLHPRYSSKTAVWFDFRELCDGPRSPSDYIELARRYNMVFVTNVPVLDDEHDNQALRFVALIDEFYDRNIKLIVSAATPIDEIYRGTRRRQEFARAMSRLSEMQSQAYLARTRYMMS